MIFKIVFVITEIYKFKQLFSQMLMGFSGGNDIDIDKLTIMLEDHRDLLSNITNNETCKDGAAAWPKLLFDLVSQSEETEFKKESSVDNPDDIVENKNTTKECNVSSAQEIVDNLPKVWKVLIELLNHQKTEQVRFNVRIIIICSIRTDIKINFRLFCLAKENGESEDCYNSVQTPTGPQLVLSVSKTYIKLKVCYHFSN